MSPNHALTPGTHEIVVDGVRQRYHVAGAGPVCIVHSGGPGVAWEYLRMAAVEAELTTVYVEPVGTGESGRLPDHPRGLDEAGTLAERAIETSPAQFGFIANALHLLGSIAAHPERLDVESSDSYFRKALALGESRGMCPLVAHCHRR